MRTTYSPAEIMPLLDEWVNGQIARWKIALDRFEEIVETNEEPRLEEDLFH